MCAGIHENKLLPAVQAANEVIFYKESDVWRIQGDSQVPWQSFATVPEVLQATLTLAKPGDYILVMSNRGFAGLHDSLLTQLKEQA